MRSLMITLFILGSVAAGLASPKSGVKGLLVMKGKCSHLVVSGKDFTADCGSALMNTEYTNGRTGFYFSAGKGQNVIFSGLGSEQLKLQGGEILQPVDSIIMALSAKSERARAVGECRFGNPFTGSTEVSCRANTSKSVYEGDFKSDGSKPAVKRF